jgi:uncharacterized membrane protein
MDFDFEVIDPMSLGLAVFGGLLSLVVMSSVKVGLIFKIGSFFFTTILCYFVAMKIINR